MLSCKEVTALASHCLDEQLPWPARFKMRLHLLVCYHCRRYLKQIKIVVKTMTRFAYKEVSDTAVTQQTDMLIKASKEINNSSR